MRCEPTIPQNVPSTSFLCVVGGDECARGPPGKVRGQEGRDMGGLMDGFDANKLCSLSLDSGYGRKLYREPLDPIQNHRDAREHWVSSQLDTGRNKWSQTIGRSVFVNQIKHNPTRESSFRFVPVRLNSHWARDERRSPFRVEMTVPAKT